MRGDRCSHCAMHHFDYIVNTIAGLIILFAKIAVHLFPSKYKAINLCKREWNLMNISSLHLDGYKVLDVTTVLSEDLINIKTFPSHTTPFKTEHSR